MFLTQLKKIFIAQKYSLSSLLIVVLVTLPLTFFAYPKQARATCIPPVPVTLVNLNPFAVPTAANGSLDLVAFGQKTATYVKTCILDGLATVIAKQIVKTLTMSIVQWINSGFKGNPAFLKNPGQFFGHIGDAIAGKVIGDIAPFLCSPFKINIELALALNFGGGTTPDQFGCTLSGVANNLQNGLGNISVGVTGSVSNGPSATLTNGSEQNLLNGNSFDSDTWYNITQNPNNNPYGAYLAASAMINTQVQSAQNTYTLQLDWGKGFLSFQDCAASSLTNSNNIGPNGQIYDSSNQPVYGVTADPNDPNCNIETPGAAIESQLELNLGSDVRQLEIAQSIDQIVAALVGQLVTQALGGIGGLLGANSGNSGGGGPVTIPDLPPGLGSCWATTGIADPGDSVTWTANVPSIVGPVTYNWSGDENLVGTGSSVTTVYGSAGEKKASVTITNRRGQANIITCQPTVTVSGGQSNQQQGTLQVSCAASPSTVSINQQTTWTATATGGNGTYSYNWRGDGSLTGFSQNVTRTYVAAGTKHATVTVFSGNSAINNVACAPLTVTP